MLQFNFQVKVKALTGLFALSLSLPASAAVVTSIKPIGFIASAIAAGVTPVEVILPDGASEHDYTLKPSNLQRIKSAELLVWVGPDMEEFMPKAASLLPENKNLQLDSLSEIANSLISGSDEEAEHHHHANADHQHQNGNSAEQPSITGGDLHHSEYNRHIWMSPKFALIAAKAIHDRLIQQLPDKKELLDSNLVNFQHQLTEANKRIRAQLLPVNKVGYFVFHDAYSYFEQYYGLSPKGYFTVNPEIQPGAQRLQKIRNQLVSQKAKCVFAEPQFRPALIDAVARGTKVRKGTLDPLGTSITLSKQSYVQFLSQLADSFSHCLKD
jgi:zinc transport system substrate-binding protein